MTRLIPSIDLIEGQVVRLQHGDFARKTVYDGSPLELAERFAAAGATELHLVDLDGARRRALVHTDVVAQIARIEGLNVQLGGGIQSDEQLERAFGLGVERVVVGSVAARDPDRVGLWLERHGPGRVVIAADVREGRIQVDAWRSETDLDVIAFVRGYRRAGARRFLCTDVSKDGLLEGPAFALYRELKAIDGVYLIASGGVRSADDLRALDLLGVEAAVVGRAIHDGVFPWQEVEALLC